MILSYDDAAERGGFVGGTPAVTIGDQGNWLDSRLAIQAGWSALTSNVEINIDFDRARRVGVVAILDYRTPDADAFAEFPVAQVTLNDPSPIHVSPSDALTLHLSSEFNLFIRHAIYVLPQEFLATGMTIGIPAPTSSYGQVTFGRIWAGRVWEPTDGIKRRWETKVLDPGEMGISRGGQGYPRLRQRRRQLDVELSHMPYSEAFGQSAPGSRDLQRIGFQVGTTTPVILLPRTRLPNGDPDSHALERLGVYGHFTDPVAIRHVAGDRFEASLRVNELL